MNDFFGPSLPATSDPSQVLIAFDLHRVVFHRTYGDIVKYLLSGHNKRLVLRLALKPRFWRSVTELKQQTTVGDEIFDKLVEQYPELAAFERDFVNLENMQAPDKGVMHIIEQLKHHGFTLYVLSNIGERAYADLSLKFPSVFALFDHVYLPRKALNYVQKPHEPFYHEFLAYAQRQGDANKQVLFIDDKVVNLIAAAYCGISGIRFSSAKQLQKLLRELSIL